MPDDILKGKRVVILGFARQGQALARWLTGIGAQVVVSDQKLDLPTADYPQVEFVLGEHPENLLAGADLLCISGGVPLDLPLVQTALQRGVPLSNDAQIFMERCPAPVIGITGSAGKTTTTTLVGQMVERGGFRTWVGGNIGSVLLEVLSEIRPEDWVVMELSSFQLEIMTCSPQIAAVLNITPNHLDRHGTMEAYTQAKAQILLHQRESDTAILCRDNAGSYQLQEAARGETLWFSAQEMVANGAFLAGQRLLVTGHSSLDGAPHVICERGEIPLRGDHNVLNALAACAIAGAANVSHEIMAEVLRAFKGVEHRLETVRVLDGVVYVNDSIATAPERVVAALRSYSEPLILLAGGKDKNLPWEEMMTLALHKARCIVAFGDAASLVVETARRIAGDEKKVKRVATLTEAVAQARALAQPGDVVLLSPGGTSYDAYRDFAERGEHFRHLVMQL